MKKSPSVTGGGRARAKGDYPDSRAAPASGTDRGGSCSYDPGCSCDSDIFLLCLCMPPSACFVHPCFMSQEQVVHVPKIVQQERISHQQVEQVVEVHVPMTQEQAIGDVFAPQA